MASGRTVKLKVKRQDGPDTTSRWEEFDLPWQPHMNVISALMDIQKRPVTASGARSPRSSGSARASRRFAAPVR